MIIISKYLLKLRKYLKKIAPLKILFYFGLITLPLFYLPGASVAYEVPKVWFFYVWVWLMTLFNLQHIKNIRRNIRFSYIFPFLLVFVVASLFSSILGADFIKSLIGNYYRWDGLVTLWSFVIFYLILTQFFFKEELIASMKFISIGSILTSTFFLISVIRMSLGNTDIANFQGIPGVTFGNPVFLTGYLLVTLPVILYVYKANSDGRTKILWLVGFLLQIAAITLTHTWGGVLGLIIFGFLLLVTFNPKYKIIFISVGIITAGLVMLMYFRTQRILVENTQGRFVAELRQRILIKGFLGFLKKPLYGYGWANFNYAFTSSDWPIQIENDAYVDKAHSSILELLVATGLIGFIIYIFFVAGSVKNFIYKRDYISKIFLIIVILYIYHSQTNVISVAEEVIFWFALSMGVSMDKNMQ